jgi:hypothetical protein
MLLTAEAFDEWGRFENQEKKRGGCRRSHTQLPHEKLNIHQ